MSVFYLIWIALGLGAAAATAALYGHYRVLPSWLTGPEVCLMEDGGCAVLFRSPRSRLLGVPNALLGVTLYVVLAIGLLLDWPAWLLFAMTLPAVAMSVFLGWSLVSRGLQCRICWTGHMANAVLALLLAWNIFHLKVDAAWFSGVGAPLLASSGGGRLQAEVPDAVYKARASIAGAAEALQRTDGSGHEAHEDHKDQPSARLSRKPCSVGVSTCRTPGRTSCRDVRRGPSASAAAAVRTPAHGTPRT